MIDKRCPTCRAAWKGLSLCARCGTDLLPLMRAVHDAFRLRNEARDAARQPDRRTDALALARQAQALDATEKGAALVGALALLVGEVGSVQGAVAAVAGMVSARSDAASR